MIINSLWSSFQRKPKLVYPFAPFLAKMRAKDLVLYNSLRTLPPSQFRVEWVKVYPEDFPLGGMSPPSVKSIVYEGAY